LISLYGVKFPDLEIYMSASHSSYALFTAWLIVVVLCSYWYGQITFSHVNSSKSYNILETIIDTEIEKKRRICDGSPLDKPQSSKKIDDDHIYVF